MPTLAPPMTQRDRQRVTLAVSVAIHLGALALLFLGRADRLAVRPERGMSVMTIVSDRDAEEQRAQEAEKPIVDVSTRPAETLFPVELPLAAVEAASSGADGEACAVAAAIQADLLVDEAARAELAALPYDERSVANAIVLWVGLPEHVRPALPATDALVFRRLQSVPAACLDLAQAGPDFIYAAVDDRTVSIAVGSGQWRWQSLFQELSLTVHPALPLERSSPATN